MSIPRLRRLAAACRLVLTLSLFSSLAAADATAADAVVAGAVVDQSGHLLPRAYVRVLDRSGAESASGFADEAGRFRFIVANAADCAVEASLTGFERGRVACASAQPVRVALAVAPIQETVIVSATRTEAPTTQAGASATVFTAEDLERRQTPLLADLLTSTPGAMVVRSGGRGALTSLFVRGGESDYNKVLLDGVPLNEPGGSFYLNNLTTENLERVEIVRGAYSALFGSDAMASVIQLFTKRADRASQRPRVSAQLDGGTYDTLHMTAAVSGATARIDYSLGAARWNSDNRVPNSRLENTTLSANIGVALGPAATLRVIGRGELEHVGTPGQTAFGRPDLDAFFDRHDAVGSVSFDQQVNPLFRQRASYSLAYSRQQSTDLIADPPYTATFPGRVATRRSTDFPNDSLTNLKRHHAGYQADVRLADTAARGNQLLTLVVDWDGERATIDNRVSNTQTMNARDNVGLSVQQQMLWRRVFVTLGGRIERNESFGTAAVPRATVVYIAHESSERFGETRLKANAGRGIKEPTMLESFSASPFFRGNPDLKPERSRSLEAGVEQRFANDRAKVELTYFDNRFRDIISLMTTNPSTGEGQFFNIGLTRARGLEAVGQAAPIAAVRVRAGYTLLDSKIVESASPDDVLFGLGKPAFRRPRHSGFAGVTLTWKRAAADLNGVFVGKFVDSDFGLFNPPLLENPGHSTWDARFTVKLTPQLTGMLAIDNVTDRDYSEPFGYQPLRRTVRGGVRVGF
jgi:outer membrane cobalamin receptor